jgi:DNA-binding transcriptional LysR family regulator
MELRHLRYFSMVAEEGHVTRAAARLGIQQAPLSQQIKGLEQELGVQLFHRRARGVELTDAGRAFQHEVRSILASVDRATATTRRVARGEQGAIRVGLTTSACFHAFAPRAIRAFRSAHPRVSIQFEQGSTPRLMERLQSDQIDAALIRTTVVRSEALRIIPLLDEAMVAAIPSGHPLARAGARRALALKTLADETFVGYPRATGAGLYDAVIGACVASGFSPQIAIEAPQIVVALYLVAAGFGVSIVPASLRRLRFDGVVYRPLAGPHRPRAELNLAMRQDAHSAPAALAFARLLKDKAASFATDAA